MTDQPLERLLGTAARDPGCDGAFEVLDQYVEAVRRGVPAAHKGGLDSNCVPPGVFGPWSGHRPGSQSHPARPGVSTGARTRDLASFLTSRCRLGDK